jgi:transposase
MPPRTKQCIYQRAGDEPAFDLKAELFRIAGVDLTDVPGISTITAHTILMEVVRDVSRFRDASAFAWLGLCPEKQVSGGRVLSTRKVRNRAAIALRLEAHCQYRAKKPRRVPPKDEVETRAGCINAIDRLADFARGE